MAGTRKPAVAARQSAKALLAQRHAQQLAEQRAHMQADETDLAAFVECQRVIDTADETLTADLTRAARQYDRDFTTAVSEFRSALDQGATNATGRKGRRDVVTEQSSIAAFGDALDQAAAAQRAAALAAAARRAATTAGARGQQGHALYQLRSRGMSIADIAAATTLSAARVSRLIKQRPTVADDTWDPTPVLADT
ncbi:hypothetical protein ACIBG0_39720 [Nocardia sp. NPDC050630]|uniref:hypothetical protein n=1 Tax=Nocardia sp. NPDC050630 TaxID=3364321 RepID=UPI00378F359A